MELNRIYQAMCEARNSIERSIDMTIMQRQRSLKKDTIREMRYYEDVYRNHKMKFDQLIRELEREMEGTNGSKGNN